MKPKRASRRYTEQRREAREFVDYFAMMTENDT